MLHTVYAADIDIVFTIRCWTRRRQWTPLVVDVAPCRASDQTLEATAALHQWRWRILAGDSPSTANCLGKLVENYTPARDQTRFLAESDIHTSKCMWSVQLCSNDILQLYCDHTVYIGLPVAVASLARNTASTVTSNKNKTAELSQRRPRDAPNICVHWKVLRVLTTHPVTFPEICNGVLFRSILRMCVQNLKFVALPVPEIIGGTQKIWAVSGYAHAPFSPKILKGFCSDGPCEYTCQVWSS